MGIHYVYCHYCGIPIQISRCTTFAVCEECAKDYPQDPKPVREILNSQGKSY